MFEKKGLIVVDSASASEDKLFELVLGAGAEDLTRAGNKFEVLAGPSEFEPVRKAIEEANIPIESAELRMIPKSLAPVSAQSARNVLSLIEALEEHDDVQHVYANCDIPDEVMKEIA
jgi:transcriptional/translational regulatory protein YebC/TACO1